MIYFVESVLGFLSIHVQLLVVNWVFFFFFVTVCSSILLYHFVFKKDYSNIVF